MLNELVVGTSYLEIPFAVKGSLDNLFVNPEVPLVVL